jgi:hypothetical protein
MIELAACQPALMYGERTSFNLAAIHLNDDVSEPVKIKVGLLRSVATVAPPRGGKDQEHMAEVTNPDDPKTTVKVRGGDAVSVFSNFDLDYLGNRKDVPLPPSLPLTTEDLNIRTRFASGQAAIDVSGNTQVVAAILGVRTVSPDTPDIHARKKRLTDCVTDISDNTTLNAIAKKLGIRPNIDDPNGTKAGIKTRIGELQLSELEALEKANEWKSCPQ